MLTPVSNFAGPYQIAASTATPSSLFSTGWVFPLKGKCAAWSSHWTLCCLASFLISVQKSGHRFPTICGARAALRFLASQSRRSLNRVAVCLPQLQTLALTTPSALNSSFRRSGTDRPSRPICKCSPCRFPSSLRTIFTKQPCDLHTGSPTSYASKPKCRGRP